MHAVDDEAVAAEVAVQPLGDAGDGSGTLARFPLDGRVGNFIRKHLGGSQALREFLDLPFRHEVAQKPPRFIGRLNGQYGLNQPLVFPCFPVHTGTLV